MEPITSRSTFRTNEIKALTACKHETVKIWDMSSADLFLEKCFQFAHSDVITGSAASLTNDYIFLTCSLDKSCLIWDDREIRSALELSKWKMYNFHYDYMKSKYKENIALNYVDTDSFIYDIETNDLYDDIRDDINYHFDTSAYPNQNIFNFPLLNKKVLGMMKDECNGKIMKEFIGLRPKMYSFKIDEGGGESKKIKGVKHCVTAKLTVADFKKCLFQKELHYDSMYVFRSKVHQLYTQHISTLVLSYSDDKRYASQCVPGPFELSRLTIPHSCANGFLADPPVANPPSADNAVNIGTKGRNRPSFGIEIILGIAAATLPLLLILNFECIAF
uniref:Uncharacterized protein n=1 Tax=Glossina morsitans morsitans TaxID=37546 RepID=A0A1B0G9Q5_GLOMM